MLPRSVWAPDSAGLSLLIIHGVVGVVAKPRQAGLRSIAPASAPSMLGLLQLLPMFTQSSQTHSMLQDCIAGSPRHVSTPIHAELVQIWWTKILQKLPKNQQILKV